jgi:quinol monooxygenase YgiN
MTIGLIARVTVAAGKGAEFEELFDWQAQQVRANEPGNKLYRLFRSREQEGAYVVMEIYEDEAAVQAHRESAHMKANRPKVLPLLAAPTVLEFYEEV